jgi:hypothetical protein
MKRKYNKQEYFEKWLMLEDIRDNDLEIFERKLR